MYTPQVPEFIRSRFLLSRMDKIVTISRHIRDKLIAYSPKMTAAHQYHLLRYRPRQVQPGTIQPGRPSKAIQSSAGNKDHRYRRRSLEEPDRISRVRSYCIRKAVPDARFALVASKSGIGQVQEFKDRAESLGLTDAVLWVGRLSKEEILSFYADLDVAVCTHRNEGFGIWVLEALSMGTPVIAFDAGGVRDSLEGCPAGKLVSGPEDMAREITDVLMDRELRQRMSEAGPQWIRERFARERMIEDYYGFFNSIIAKKG